MSFREFITETLEALKILGHAESREALETAMKLIGTPSQEGNRDRRLSGFTDRFDDLQKQFGPLESAYYRTKGRLKQSMLLYAVEHADHFRPGPTGGT